MGDEEIKHPHGPAHQTLDINHQPSASPSIIPEASCDFSKDLFTLDHSSHSRLKLKQITLKCISPHQLHLQSFFSFFTLR